MTEVGFEYIVVQAGGKGTRLGDLTKNKPKALVPVNNLPMLFYLFRRFPQNRFVIIADYKKDVLRKYLSSFSEVQYQVVDAEGAGTCGGISQALELIPQNKSFMLIWSDLILPDDLSFPTDQGSDVNGNYIGISGTFPCRWKYDDGEFVEEKSVERGVAGLFIFSDKIVLCDVPDSGELVAWMKTKKLKFKDIDLSGTREFGLLEEYEKLDSVKTRPFNSIHIDGEKLVKEPIDEQGKALAQREGAWYKKAFSLGITGVPQIYGYDPISMEYIYGKNLYDCDMSSEEKKALLGKTVKMLDDLHRSAECEADSFSVKEAYYNKTVKRLLRVEHMIPFADRRQIVVNGRTCQNVFFCLDKMEKLIDGIRCDGFSLIHGDCTFSNIMVRENGDPVMIDPRGYFGYTELYGDERYDWAKLYYSIVGNYDMFNLKKFTLDIGGESGSRGTMLGDNEVALSIKSNGWEDLEEEFFTLTDTDRNDIKLLHAVIWLSLTTYAWHDYDSVCGAFYNGLYYLQEVL